MTSTEKGEIATVIAGHFGFAALVKSREKFASLWILMLSSIWLDLVFVPLFLAGVETIQPMLVGQAMEPL